MATKEQAAKPIMTEAGIRSRTGKGWDEWFSALDKAGAGKLDHQGITSILAEKMKVGPWWGQMIAVSYERARGLRAMNQKCDGQFAVSVSKTLPVDLSTLYQAVTDEKQRKKWFPKGPFKVSSQTKDKYFRGAWGTNGGRLEVGFYARGQRKAQIALQVNKLTSNKEVETERAIWKEGLARLEALLRRSRLD